MKSILRTGTIRLLIIFFVGIQSAWSQLPAIAFEVITSKEGLPSNTVLTATRDREGFIWFGTRQSPVRYDGVNFQNFTAYITNFVTGIQADKENNIWFSSDRSGVCKIEPHTMQMTRVSNQEPDVSTTGFFYIDSRGQGWYSDFNGVNRIDLATGERKHYPLRQTTYVGLKASFVEDRDNTLWIIGRDNGLFRYDSERDTLLCVLGLDSPEPRRLDQVHLANGCLDQDGFLWIGTYNYGLLKYDPRRNKIEVFQTGRLANQIVSVAEGWDENGRRVLWVGDEEGLGIFRPDQHKFYFFPDILSKSYEVNYIYRDKVDGIVWVCTSEGIIKYHPMSNVIQGVTIPSHVLQHRLSINVIHQDKRPGKEHLFYLGTSNNILLRWDRRRNEFFPIEYPGGAAETRWIEQREDGNLWIGTNRWDYQRPGIFVYDLETNKFKKPPLTILTNKFFSVPFFMYGSFDNNRRLWIGNSDEGVRVLDEKSITEVTPWSNQVMNDLIKNNNLINDMMLDKQGRLWVGTYLGVFYYDDIKNEFICADPKDLPAQMDDSAVNSLFEDARGNVWAARWGSLTMMTKPGELSTIVTTQDGFSDRQIQGLAEDYAGNIWAGNYEGLYCFIPAQNRLIKFTINDGLLSNNTLNRIFISLDKKELLVGHINGFNLVKVDQLLRPAKAPPLVINSFKIHEKEYHTDFTKLIRMKPSDNAFSVDFVALNYRKQDDNQYAYYLDGFEKEWNYSGSKHTAYYTNLNPGSYTLRMKVGDAFGNWNNDTLQMQIEVLPAFYQTAWFKILISLAVAGLLYMFYRYRINQLLHLQQVRNRISADLHDELGSTLSGISIMGSLAKNELPSRHNTTLLFDRIMEDVSQISSSLDDIVWNISPKNDALSSLVARMTRYASELFEAKQIDFRLVMPDRLDDIKLSMDQRRNIYLIFKESVNNLVKYAQCTHASVSVRIEKGNVFLMVQDNGIGFDPNKLTDRNGIRNLKERALGLKGILDIRSVVGEGTTIRLEFPIAR